MHAARNLRILAQSVPTPLLHNSCAMAIDDEILEEARMNSRTQDNQPTEITAWITSLKMEQQDTQAATR